MGKGKDFTQGELDGELREAGSTAAGAFIKACVDSSTTAEEKSECFKSQGAKDAFAQASGLDAKNIKAVDLKKAYSKFAGKDVADTMRACVQVAGDNVTAKKLCFMDGGRDGGLKDMIAGAKGIARDKVKDSDVRGFAQQGARSDVLAVLKSCNRR